MKIEDELLEFIKGRIRRWVNSNILIKRKLRTIDGREKFISKKSEGYLPAIQEEIALRMIHSLTTDEDYKDFSDKELAQLVDEFLLSDDFFKNWIDIKNYTIPKLPNDIKNIRIYTKVALTKLADIEIAANLRTFPKIPTLKQLESESQNVLKKGKVSQSNWCRHHENPSFWRLVIEEIELRLNSNRKMKQDTVDKLIELKDILRLELVKLECRKEWELRLESGDIYEEKMPIEYKDDNFNYINIKKDKSPDLGDNFDDKESKELDDY